MKKTLICLLAAMMLALMLPLCASAQDDVVTIKAMWEATRPENEYTEETRQYIREHLGIDLELTQVSENFSQQLALSIAGGDIPDLIWMTYDTYVQYAEDGLFADLTDKIAAYPDIMSYVDTNGYGEACWQRMTVDGRIYGVPTRSVNPTMYTAAIRQDWLDKLNLAVPQTLDELTEVLRAFTEDDPDGDGVNDTYGVTCAGLDYLSVFFGAFGATSMQDYLLREDGTVTTNVISENYREALRYLSDIYAKGYMDPEVFTQSGAQTYEKFATAKAGYWPNWWSNSGSVYMKYGFADNNPDGQLTVMQPVKGANGQSGLPACDPIWRTVAISTSCEHVDKVLELINWECTPYGWYTVMNGVEGDYFEMNDAGEVTWYCRVTSGYRKQLGIIKCGMSVDRVLRTADMLSGENEILVTVGGRLVRNPQESGVPAGLAEAPDGVTAGRDGWHQRTIESLGMRIYVRRSMRSIWEEYWRDKGVFLVLALLAIAVMLAASSSVLGSVVRRLRRLEQLANGIEIREGIHLPDEGNDEVGCVVRAFNSLFERLERKNAELLQKERDKRHSQLQALQYQLNPHFLFNSLHWLQLRLEERGVDSETSESITQLGSVLRYNLSESLEATLAQEADQLQAYVGFMSEMKEQPIALRLAWPQTLNGVKVLRFVLQPLVENALRHGLVRGRSMLITVSAAVGGGWLTIRVENDGRSIDPQTLARLRAVFDRKTSDAAAGIGLNNLVYRLSLRYGMHYQLEVESGEGCTAFIIRIPEESRQEEDGAHALSGG